MRILTTGVSSGLGRFLHERLGGTGLALTPESRREELESLARSRPDVIIHCAANPARDVDAGDLFDYFDDNVLLTKELAGLPHKKFIFLSSVDVYPRSADNHREDEPIGADSPRGVYPMAKLISESVVRRRCPDHLILRATALLGARSRRNSLIRMIEDDPCSLTLAGDSAFNYVRHEDVLEFIEAAIERGLSGTYNAASAGNVTLSEIAGMLGKAVTFGSHRYDAGRIDNRKIAAVCPAFQRSSRETAERFIAERSGARSA
ncbi:MAG: NAD-dependent epimerase/dehydratase family protein [Elusimicrobiota bacterium]